MTDKTSPRLINGMQKMKENFGREVFLDELFSLDFYGTESSGLGKMLLRAKRSQDKGLIRSIVAEIRPRIISVVEKNNIDGVLFIPSTLPREIQFMKEVEKHLNLPLKSLSATKIKSQRTVPQKALAKLEERIKNARNSIRITGTGTYDNILLIDDAVGSGATLNTAAEQIRTKKLCRGKIIGLAIVCLNELGAIDEI
jgi:predicted amidophosphoribosyltransferase